MLRDGTGPGLLRRRGAAVGNGNGEGGSPVTATRLGPLSTQLAIKVAFNQWPSRDRHRHSRSTRLTRGQGIAYLFARNDYLGCGAVKGF